MALAIPVRRAETGRPTLVYEFFDERVLGHLWFVAVSDGTAVQMMAPTFRSERSARIFARCVADHPSGFLLSIDGQLELGRRIEECTAKGQEPDIDAVYAGLVIEQKQP